MSGRAHCRIHMDSVREVVMVYADCCHKRRQTGEAHLRRVGRRRVRILSRAQNRDVLCLVQLDCVSIRQKGSNKVPCVSCLGNACALWYLWSGRNEMLNYLEKRYISNSVQPRPWVTYAILNHLRYFPKQLEVYSR